ncbi:MAG: glutamate-1-semialdehyde 2,1-aminomutase, partial [Deltaproteobacteria bacterium]|nr:glutamate-1-semialdehyde 2,1-aminomutase [Deltaproteobacteria bacterium]
VKFDGCYHGHADTLLVAAGSGVATLGIPGSPGVPEAFVQKTLSLPFNDVEQVTEVVLKKGDDIAAIIVEPIAGNMGLVPPEPGFLQALRTLTEKRGIILILDEVMTGFRVAYGGAQALYDVTPDLTCLGKIIGGGLPVGAYGGRKEIMKQMAPEGPVYQAGTLSGNPVAMAAGIATLKCLQQPDFYESLEASSALLEKGLVEALQKAEIPGVTNRIGSMLGLFFTEKQVTNFADAQTSDTDRFSRYFREMLDRGIYMAPSQFEAVFVSGAHNEGDIQATILAANEVFGNLRI